MKRIDLSTGPREDAVARFRISCRAIVYHDGKILLSFETNTGVRSLPGGGIDEGETPAECCLREVEEETGYLVADPVPCIAIHEYLYDFLLVQQYFICRLVGNGRQNLTDDEAENGMMAEWMPAEDVLAFFDAHAADPACERHFVYQREAIALREALRTIRARS